MAKKIFKKAIQTPVNRLLVIERCNELATKLTQMLRAMSSKPSGTLKQSLFAGMYERPATVSAHRKSTKNSNHKRHDTRRCFLKMQQEALPLFSPKENNARLMTDSEIKKYGPLLKAFNPNVKFRP